MIGDVIDVIVEVPGGSRNRYEPYKELEPDESSHTAGFDGRTGARVEIVEALERYSRKQDSLVRASSAAASGNANPTNGASSTASWRAGAWA